MENWQSEYLQFTLYILLTVWLVQRGSPESKQPGQEGGESDEAQLVGDHARPNSPRWARMRGARRRIYENSLVLVMATIWISSWLAQSITGVTEYNAERLSHQEAAVPWTSYLGTADFWERTLENWQSEFLAVGSMAVLAIYLRQRGSPESKPVGAPHHATGTEVSPGSRPPPHGPSGSPERPSPSFAPKGGRIAGGRRVCFLAREAASCTGQLAAAATAEGRRSPGAGRRGAVPALEGAAGRPPARRHGGRDTVDLPVLRGRLRAEGLRRGRRGHADRGRPRLPDLARAAVPQGRGVQAARHEPARASGRSSTGRPYGTEWEELALERAMDMIADRRDRNARAAPGKATTATPAPATARSASPASAARRSTTRRTTSSRSCSPRWGGPDREPGPHMTLLHGPRSGDLVRARRRHDLPAGPGQLRLHRDPGLEHGRVPPGRLPVGDRGQGARRDGDPRRPALHAHERDGRPARADPRRQRHRVPRRPHQPTCSSTSASSASTSSPTPTPRRSCDEDFRDTEDLDGLFSGWDPETSAYDTTLVAVRGRPWAGGRQAPRRARRGEQAARRARRGGSAGRAAARRPDAPAPALRVPAAEAALRRYTPGDGRARSAASRASRSSRWPRRCARTRAASARPRSSTRSAGPSTPSACSTSAPPRSSSCCSATSAGPAGGSWRCAATPRSRARPTSRRSTTSCPATSRCRRPHAHRGLDDYVER